MKCWSHRRKTVDDDTVAAGLLQCFRIESFFFVGLYFTLVMFEMIWQKVIIFYRINNSMPNKNFKRNILQWLIIFCSLSNFQSAFWGGALVYSFNYSILIAPVGNAFCSVLIFKRQSCFCLYIHVVINYILYTMYRMRRTSERKIFTESLDLWFSLYNIYKWRIRPI